MAIQSYNAFNQTGPSMAPPLPRPRSKAKIVGSIVAVLMLLGLIGKVVSSFAASTPLTAEKLTGRWNSTATLKTKYFTATITGVDTYRADGTSESVDTETWVVGKPLYDSEATIRIVSKSAGTWRIEGGELIETDTALERHPASDADAAKLHQSTQLEGVLLRHKPSGKEVRIKIDSVTDSTINLSVASEDKDTTISGTMTRISNSVPAATSR